MEPLTAHKRAQDVFAMVLANVAPDQLGSESPCPGWDAQGVIDHMIAGNQLVLIRAGREPSPLPDDAVAAYTEAAAGAHEVFSAPDGLTRIYETAAGPIPGAVFIGLRTIDALTHAWDVAVATGQSTDLDPALAIYAREVAEQLMAPRFRGPGKPFGDEQPCPAGRSPADGLAAYLGRAVT